MSAKKKKAQKMPPLRSKDGIKRDEFIQFRVSSAEKKYATETFRRRLGHALRAFLLGHPVPEPSHMEDDDKCQLIHALHAQYMVNERVFTCIELGDIDGAKQLRSEQNQTFKHLFKLCYSNFSK